MSSQASQFNISPHAEGASFFTKIVPGSSKTTLVGVYDGKLKVKVAAPPEKGKANQCLIEFLAHQLGIKKKAIRILSGQTSPVKQILVSGLVMEEIRNSLFPDEGPA